MLKRIKDMRRVWKDMNQTEQNMLAEGLAYDARRLVEEAIAAITAFGFPRAVGLMAKMVVIPGDKARIETPIHFANIPENLAVLGGSVGKEVAIVMVDSSVFKGEREPVKTDPDQPPLPMGEGGATDTGDNLDAKAPAEGDTGDDDPDPDPTPELLALPAPDREEQDSEDGTNRKAEIDQDAAEFEASAEELEQQAPRQRRRKLGSEAA
ncbi:hypothetical protein [Rubellimicrobium arenae]|uniref:hypothetical protein n=1 Tax=Rubellimicrobium arenae TaxID=2817372 RepID=UPI001B31817A|nr:hypothetical protein [Rubellimicrobium arenae]